MKHTEQLSQKFYYSETCLHQTPFRLEEMFHLDMLKTNGNLYKGTQESVWLRQVFDFLCVWFTQVLLYNSLWEILKYPDVLKAV